MLIFLPDLFIVVFNLLIPNVFLKVIKLFFLNIQEKKCLEYVKFVIKKHLLEIA